MAEITKINKELVSEFEPARIRVGHKYNFGTALICAGSEYMSGAAVLATGSALRSGAGLVKVFSENKTLDAVRFTEPCALLELRPDTETDLLRKASGLCQKTDAVLIGSGIPVDYKHMEALTGVFLNGAANVVLDAGALSGKPDVCERLKSMLRNRKNPAVITPHTGEFARLIGVDTGDVIACSEELALQFATGNNCIVVLKGYETLVADPSGKLYRYSRPDSGFAKGGSGDVLAGLITGLLAQHMEPYKAAVSAVFIHSKAGEAAIKELGIRSVLPSDFIRYLTTGFDKAGWLISDSDRWFKPDD